jgi:hypothetical protein
MSNSSSAGYYADQQLKTDKEPCPKNKDKPHVWKMFGSWPSTWKECKNCGTTTYSK